MAASLLPALIDALVTSLPATMPAGTLVTDGMPVTDDPSNFLIIGSNAVEVTDWAQVATAELSRMSFGPSRHEQGSLYCIAEGWNGDGNMKAARDAAYAITDAVSAWLITNPTAGLTALEVIYGVTADPISQQSDSGALWRIPFTVDFQARTEQ